MFTPVGQLLKDLPRRSKVSEAVLALAVRQAFNNGLGEACRDLPSETLKQVQAFTFKNGLLTVRAPSLTATELQMRAGGLLTVVNRLLGKQIVQRIQFKII